MMNDDELREYLRLLFCWCGDASLAASALLRLLRLQPFYEHLDEFSEWIPDGGVRTLLLYQLDNEGLTEHGGSVMGGWLTAKGEDVLSLLEAHEADGFLSLLG